MNATGRSSSERGAVVVMVAVWLPVLALFASFAIDFGHFFDYSRNLQNRADAAAIAGGDQLGNLCAANPTDPRTSPELAVGQMAQLFSGPPGSASDLPYPYNGAGSPLSAFPSYGGYQNQPNLTVSNGGNGANYHVLLNADDYAPAGGSNFAIGDFCHGDPTLDKTDKECYGQTNLTGQLAKDCATGAMVDAKVTQSNLPLFFPLLGFSPDISATARVSAQGIGQANNLKPLGVEDAGVTPCVRVKFFGGAVAQTVQLAVNKGLTTSNGPIIWDNSTANGNTGDPIGIPTGSNLRMQAILYAPGSDGTCATIGSPLTYETTSGKEGILLVNSYGTSAPPAHQAPLIVGAPTASGICPPTEACGVTLLDNTCSRDQYFSSNLTSCTVNVCAIVAFTPLSSNRSLTLNGANNSMIPSTDPNCTTSAPGASAFESRNPVTIASASGQHQFTLEWNEDMSGGLTNGSCNGGGHCSGTFNVQQQAFSACDENFNDTCGGAPNISGPILQAYLSQGATSTIGSFQGGKTQNLVITLALQGLQDSPRTDRCSVGLTQCTLLRVDEGNGDGMVDCGEGNGTGNGARLVILYGCPLYGQPSSAPNGGCQNDPYCGGWQPVPVGTPDGVCNYAGRTAATSVDCVNTNNNGATIPECLQALVVAGASGNGIDYSQINSNNCHVTGSQCSEDKWLTGTPIDPTTGPTDPRLVTAFIVYQGDISGATGNHDMQIRTFATFYVTGWQVKGNGRQSITCPPGAGANEPPPSTLPSNANAIWGHWITYTEPGAGGNGTPCDFNAFGDCAVVLTR
jgi:Putative Flp pilus-assembly TadE/G-like